MRFAHLKTHHRFERVRLRGLSGARDEFHLAATVQNLKTLAKLHLARAPGRADRLRYMSVGRFGACLNSSNCVIAAATRSGGGDYRRAN
jgi:hypothetical protein